VGATYRLIPGVRVTGRWDYARHRTRLWIHCARQSMPRDDPPAIGDVTFDETLRSW